MKIQIRTLFAALIILSTLNPQLSTLFAQGTSFAYQGRLNDGTNPANGTYEILFRPFEVLTGGSELAPAHPSSVAVSNGLFSTTMDFGPSLFDGNPRYLQ